MTDAAGPAPSYPLQRTGEEMARLRMQAAALAPDAEALLDAIGVRPGWHCLDLGCGVGGIMDLLSRRAGPGGRVVGVDNDPDKLAAAAQWARAERLEGLELVEADIYGTGLPGGAFDLVHLRFVFTTIGRHEALLAEALRLTRPGGVLAVQEADTTMLACHPPHPAWDRLKEAVTGTFAALGADTRVGRRMFAMLHRRGLTDLGLRVCLLGFTREHPMADFLPATALSMRRAIVGAGLLSAGDLDACVRACRRHLADPATTSTSYVVFQVWGRTPR